MRPYIRLSLKKVQLHGLISSRNAPSSARVNVSSCEQTSRWERKRKRRKERFSFHFIFTFLFFSFSLPLSFLFKSRLASYLRVGHAENSPWNWVRERLESNHFCLIFFTAIATSNVEDIRSVLDFYRQEDDIIEAFKRNQARLREAEEARSPQQGARSSWTGMFGRGFSFGRSSNKSVSWNKSVLICC